MRRLSLLGVVSLILAVVPLTISVSPAGAVANGTQTTSFQISGSLTPGTGASLSPTDTNCSPGSPGGECVVGPLSGINVTLNMANFDPQVTVVIAECQGHFGNPQFPEPTGLDGPLQCTTVNEDTTQTSDVNGNLANFHYTIQPITSAQSGGTTACDVANLCTMYVGENLGDFSQPHALFDFDLATFVPPLGGAPSVFENSAGGNPSDPWLCTAQGGALGDPCAVESGTFFETHQDLTVGGRGVPLNLSRTYSSALAAVTGAFGPGWTYSYGMNLVNNAGAVTIEQENGTLVGFVTGSGGGFVPAAPRTIATLVHNANGTWTFTRDGQEQFGFDSTGRLVSETDLNGYVTSLAYDTSGHLHTVKDQSARLLTFTWTGTHITKVVDPLARAVSYTYDTSGNLITVTDVALGKTEYTYDTSHRMLTKRTPVQTLAGVNGKVITNTYDTQGRLATQTDQLARKTTFAYAGTPSTGAGGTTTITDPKGNVTVDSYLYGLLASQTRGSGTSSAATTSYTYDPATLGTTSVSDPNGHVTTKTYDASGNVLTSTDPLSRTTTNTYNAFNEVLTTTDPLGVATTNTYDAKGNVTATSRPLTGTSTVETTAFGHGDSLHPGDATSTTNPDGFVTTLTYDTHGDLASSTDPLGDKTTNVYNTNGWLTSTVSPKGNVKGAIASQFTTTYLQDKFGNVTTVTDPLKHVTTTTRDADQNITSVKDADANTTKYTYDAADELTTVTRADLSLLKTTYWPDGSVQSQADGTGATTQYAYDPLGRQSSVTDPLTHTTSYTYGGAGNLLTVTDPAGQVTTNTYDAANELTGTIYSDGTTPGVTGITYDADGQRTGQTDGSGTWSWTWDSLHRLSSVTEGANGTVGYAYDLRNLPTSITYPGGTNTVTHTYDNAGRLATVTDWLANTTTFGYDANSNQITQTLPATTGVVDKSTFNNANQLTAIADAKGTTSVFAATYTRDGNGQVLTDSSQATTFRDDKYTPLNQLCYAGSSASGTCAAPPTGAIGYTYDKAGNAIKDGSVTQTFNAADELCWSLAAKSTATCTTPPTGVTTYTYDLRGNRTAATPATGTATSYSYDQANRLIGYTHGATTASYAYNGDGLRASGGLVWDVAGQLPLVLADSTNAYVYGPGGLPLEQITGTTVSWLHHDQLGGTRVITSSTGAAVGAFTFNPYGTLLASAGTVTTPLMFAGQYLDAATGLYYLRGRYYDDVTAAFLTAGPGQSYVYAGDNPLNVTEPKGVVTPAPRSTTRARGAIRTSTPTDAGAAALGRTQVWFPRH